MSIPWTDAIRALVEALTGEANPWAFLGITIV